MSASTRRPGCRRAAAAFVAGAGLLLVGAVPAVAAPTASFDTSAGTLTVTGDAAAQTFAVASSAGDQVVATSADLNDPDGAGSDCAASAAGVSCKGSVVRTIVIDAGDGDDALSGVYALDPIASVRLNGQGGDDALTSNNFFGQFRLDGGPGDDELNAGIGRFASSPFGNGSDTATGGAGDDTFNGGGLVDNFAAEPGADTYRGGPSPGPEGFPVFNPRYTPADEMSYDGRAGGVTVTLDDRPDDGSAGEGDNVGADVESVSGGAGNDTLRAGATAVFLRGDLGDDTIAGGPARDVLSGGDGDDAIDALDANVDEVVCGAGNDSATIDYPVGQPPVGDADSGCEALDIIGFGQHPGAKPVVKLTAPTISSKAFRRTGALRLTVDCAPGCSIKGTAYLKSPGLRARLGRGAVGLGRLPIGSGSRSLTVRISAAYRVKLKHRLRTRAQRRRGISFTVRLTATNVRRVATTARATVDVKG